MMVVTSSDLLAKCKLVHQQARNDGEETGNDLESDVCIVHCCLGFLANRLITQENTPKIKEFKLKNINK